MADYEPLDFSILHTPSSKNFGIQIWRFLGRHFGKPRSLERLRDHFSAAQGNIKALEDADTPDKKSKAAVLDKYRTALEAMKAKNASSGWAAFKAAKRRHLVIDPRNDAADRRASILRDLYSRIDDEKVPKSIRSRIRNAFGAGTTTPPKFDTVKDGAFLTVTEIWDEYIDDRHLERDYKSQRFVSLSWILVGVLLCFFLLTCCSTTVQEALLTTSLEPDGQQQPVDPPGDASAENTEDTARSNVPITTSTLMVFALAGAMGACVSSYTSLQNAQDKPNIFTSRAATLARPIVGAVVAVMGALGVKFVLVDVNINLPALIFFCFLFGFSQQLVIGVAERYRSTD